MDEVVADAAVDLAVELVRIDSVNPSLTPGGAGERDLVEFLGRRLTRAGFDVEVVPAAGAVDRPSLLATARGRGGGRSIVLNGHLDTVGVHGMPEPFTGRIDGDPRTGRLIGRGACDMKAGVAAMVAAAEAVAARRPAGDVVLALVADEEHASLGTEAVVRRLRAREGGRLPDACLVGEPSWLDLVVVHRGYALVEVTLHGRAAHSSQPGLGIDAAAHLGRLLTAVEARNNELAKGPAHASAGTGSLLVTVARAGTTPFVLADSALAVIERRTVPGESAGDALAEVEHLLVALRAADPSVDALALLTLAREAWEHDPGAPAAVALAGDLAAALTTHGHPPQEVAVPYWMDSALWQGAGVPTVVCGPAGGGMHGADEWADLTEVRAYASALTDALVSFCGAPAP